MTLKEKRRLWLRDALVSTLIGVPCEAAKAWVANTSAYGVDQFNAAFVDNLVGVWHSKNPNLDKARLLNAQREVGYSPRVGEPGYHVYQLWQIGRQYFHAILFCYGDTRSPNVWAVSVED